MFDLFLVLSNSFLIFRIRLRFSFQVFANDVSFNASSSWSFVLNSDSSLANGSGSLPCVVSEFCAEFVLRIASLLDEKPSRGPESDDPIDISSLIRSMFGITIELGWETLATLDPVGRPVVSSASPVGPRFIPEPPGVVLLSIIFLCLSVALLSLSSF